jgi:hypothetical protein
MAVTKTNTVLHNDESVAAGGADETSSAVDLTAVDEAAVNVKITNGATGPTVAGQCQLELSNDNTNWHKFGGPLQGGVTNSGVYSWAGIRVPTGTQRVRAVIGSNTGQAVTYRVDCSTYTKT